MTAKQKTRKIYAEPESAFNKEILVQSSNEIELCQKVELIMGGTPDPQNTGNYKGNVVSVDAANRKLNLGIDVFKFAPGDEVVIYSSLDYKANKVKNCVKAIDGFSIELYNEIPTQADNLIVEKNLIFRVSNVATYRVDEYGIGRAYDAIAGLSNVESSMGEMFEGKWNRSDYSFTIDNYDKRFDKYMPGGELSTSFALKEVNVYIGFGEEFDKNKLIFQGVTNLNNGISEEDEKLSITAYDISYLYNIQLQTNRFSAATADPEFIGKQIPVLFGDYTSFGKFVGGVQRPIIPAVLYRFTTTSYPARLILNSANFAISNSLLIQSLTDGPSFNNYEIELIYSNEEKLTDISPSCVETAIAGSKFKWTVTLYRGRNETTKTLYSSTKWIRDCLLTKSNFTSRFICIGSVNEPILYYKNLVLIPREDDYVGDVEKTELYFTSGGTNTTTGHYKICSNGLSQALVGSFKVWYNNGDYDTAEDWESDHGKYNGGSVTTTWDTANGEVAVTLSGSHALADLLKKKLYVFVAGQALNTDVKTDDKLLFNISNNVRYDTFRNVISGKSGNGEKIQSVGLFNWRQGGGFPLGGYFKVRPFLEKIVTTRTRVCDTFLGIKFNCTTRVKTNYTEEYSSKIVSFKKTSINAKNFVFETQLNNELSIFSGYRFANNSQKNIAVFGIKTDEKENNKLFVYLNSDSRVCVNYNGQITEASNQAISSTDIYGIRVRKEAGKIRIFVRNITDATAYSEVTYTSQPTLLENISDLNYCIMGNSKFKPDYTSGGFNGNIGMFRFRADATAFAHEPFTNYGVPTESSDIVSIAKKIIQYGGAGEDMFDETFDTLVRSKVAQQYNVRCYINDEDIKTIDYAVELLAQVGIVLTMKESRNKMRFSLIWDSIDFYKKSDYRITSYDIELNSVNVDRELNQYFNTANAKYNYCPATDELEYSFSDLYEPNALKRDGNLNIWFNREEKGLGTFEFPSIYIDAEAQNLIKYKIANSTPNSEMITMKLSWRHLALQLGDFVILSHGRYVNVPCQVRSLNLDANGSSVEIKLRSLESINFIDAETGVEYVPTNFENIGGLVALTNITNQTNNGDV